MSKRASVWFFCMLFWAGFCSAQDSSCLELLGRWGYGLSEDVAADENYVYIGNGTILQIYSIANPSAPALVSEIMLEGFIREITLNEMEPDTSIMNSSHSAAKPEKSIRKTKAARKYAFVAVSRAGMVIVDVTDASNPFVAGSFPVSWVCGSVAVSGQYAFVSDSAETTVFVGAIHVVDVSEVGNPWEVRSIEAPYVHGLAIYGKYLFASNVFWEGDRTLITIDIAEPSFAHIVNVFTAETWPDDVIVHALGGQVYAFLCSYFDLVQVADVTDPLHPVLLGFLEFQALDIAFWGTTAYAAGEFGGMNIYDMSNPLKPKYLGGTVGENIDIRAYAVAVPRGDYAYVANWTVFSVFDVRDPSWPPETATYESGGWTGSIAVDGTVVYASSGLAGIKILDFSDPSAPNELSRLHTRGQALGVLKEGAFLYVADNQYLSIYDVSNPSHPTEAGFLPMAASATELAKRGDFVYVLGVEYGLVVVNVANPQIPFFAGQLYTGTDVRNIVIDRAYLYLADAELGLCVIDISEPESPRMAWIQGNAVAESLAIEGDRLYIANWDNYLSIYDISNPESPQLIAKPDVGGNIYSPAIRDPWIFAAYSTQEGDYRIIELDVSDPFNIVAINDVQTMYTLQLELAEGRLYGTNPYTGVGAFDLLGCGFVSPHVRPLGPP